MLAPAEGRSRSLNESPGQDELTPAPTREVIQADALRWLVEQPAAPQTSVITSLPDVSELPELGLDGWRSWFYDAACQVVGWLPADGVAIFFQSDIRYRGVWVDKGYLVLRAAESLGGQLLWHKIVCRRAPGTITHGRASYSHLICVSRVARDAPKRPGPDVLPDAGFMPYPKAMGAEAARLACRFLLDETPTRLVVDPFCGRGTVLAVANALGLNALGVDRSARACRAARGLKLSDQRVDGAWQLLPDAGS